MLEIEALAEDFCKKIPGMTIQKARIFVLEELNDAITDLLVLRYWDHKAEQRVLEKYPNQVKHEIPNTSL